MSEATAPMPDRCPRCGGPVGCGIASATPCWCTGLKVDPAARAELARRHDGCLCRTCLEKWQARPPETLHPAPT